ncbi:NPC intracellular cholesterol transporter 2-like [Crassostrea virginica]
MLREIVLLFVSLSLPGVCSIIFKDCGSVSGKIATLDVSGCSTEPCIFYSGTNETLHATFTSSVESKTPTTIVTGIIAGLPVPFPAEKNTCTHQTHCPIEPNQQNDFTITVPVLTSYPHISLLVKGEVRDDSGKDIFCFVFPAQIKPKN